MFLFFLLKYTSCCEMSRFILCNFMSPWGRLQHFFSVKNELQFGSSTDEYLSLLSVELVPFMAAYWFSLIAHDFFNPPPFKCHKLAIPIQGTLYVDRKLLEKVAGKTNSHCFVTIVICFWLAFAFQFSLQFRLIFLRY